MRHSDGSRNRRTSAFKDHACSDMHKRAMQLFHRANSKGIPDNAPIAKALLTMDQGAQRRIKKKFETAYFLKKTLPSVKWEQSESLKSSTRSTWARGTRIGMLVLTL